MDVGSADGSYQAGVEASSMTTHKMWCTDIRDNWYLFECPECGYVFEVRVEPFGEQVIVPPGDLVARHTDGTVSDTLATEIKVRLA